MDGGWRRDRRGQVELVDEPGDGVERVGEGEGGEDVVGCAGWWAVEMSGGGTEVRRESISTAREGMGERRSGVQVGRGKGGRRRSVSGRRAAAS